MKEGMLQVQLLVPTINADATVTASVNRNKAWELKLMTDVKVLAATSQQKIALRYGKIWLYSYFLVILLSNSLGSISSSHD